MRNPSNTPAHPDKASNNSPAPFRRTDATKRGPPQPVQQETWGIVRYAPMSGVFCDEDAAGFDGWYTLREDAPRIAEDWARRFPGWVIGLVSSDQIWFGNCDFSGARDRPLTERENRFAHPERCVNVRA